MEVIIVAVISLIGTMGGSLLGVIASQRLTQHRLAELEKKMDKLNQLIERMARAESRIEVIEASQRTANSFSRSPRRGAEGGEIAL